MPGGTQSKGKCAYCGHETTKGSMTKHLTTCPQRQEAVVRAEQAKTGSERLYYLRVQDAYQKEFWLDLEMRGSASLNDLDKYLRAIWLECCGHLSRFSIGGWQSREIAKKRHADEVLRPGIELVHIYDFGTESETLIKVVDVREGVPTTSRPIALMARNLLTEAVCRECQQPAVWLCMECLIEHNEWGTLCDEHAQAHPHGDYGEPVRLVNSPRLGKCGYVGPADPPY